VPECISEIESRKLLADLCTELGFCLSPLWTARLERNPPRSVDKFTETVFRAEGLDPVAVNTDLYRSVRKKVEDAFARSGAGK
jgi:hypothetical protein